MSASIVIIDCNKSGVSILSYSAPVSGCRGSNAEEVDGGGVSEIFHSAPASGCRNDSTEEVNGGRVPVVSHPALVGIGIVVQKRLMMMVDWVYRSAASQTCLHPGAWQYHQACQA